MFVIRHCGIPIENPILHRVIGSGGRVRTVRPVALDRVDQAVLVRVRGFLSVGSLGLEI